MRRYWVWARRVAVIGVTGVLLGFVGCTLTVDNSSLTNGICPPKQKGCSIDGVIKCVDATSPKYGCNSNPTDTHQCFSCGTLGFQHGTPTCNLASGACAVSSCDMGYLNCNDNQADGCEVSLNTDPENCGNCGIRCPLGSPHQTGSTCQLGKCVATCEAFYVTCAAGSVCDCGPNKTCVNRVCM